MADPTGQTTIVLWRRTIFVDSPPTDVSPARQDRAPAGKGADHFLVAAHGIGVLSAIFSP